MRCASFKQRGTRIATCSAQGDRGGRWVLLPRLPIHGLFCICKLQCVHVHISPQGTLVCVHTKTRDLVAEFRANTSNIYWLGSPLVYTSTGGKSLYTGEGAWADSLAILFSLYLSPTPSLPPHPPPLSAVCRQGSEPELKVQVLIYANPLKHTHTCLKHNVLPLSLCYPLPSSLLPPPSSLNSLPSLPSLAQVGLLGAYTAGTYVDSMWGVAQFSLSNESPCTCSFVGHKKTLAGKYCQIKFKMRLQYTDTFVFRHTLQFSIRGRCCKWWNSWWVCHGTRVIVHCSLCYPLPH